MSTLLLYIETSLTENAVLHNRFHAHVVVGRKWQKYGLRGHYTSLVKTQETGLKRYRPVVLVNSHSSAFVRSFDRSVIE